jgi:WD40 repeat protein
LAVSWSPSGEAFLCVTGSAQPRFYDRDGKLLGECVRGDMYIRDMKNTKGHITGCSGGCWHPIDRYTAVTSSEDGTVRCVALSCLQLPLSAGVLIAA